MERYVSGTASEMRLRNITKRKKGREKMKIKSLTIIICRVVLTSVLVKFMNMKSLER